VGYLLSQGRAVLAALAGFQLLLLLIRLPFCRQRRELAMFFLILSFSAAAGLLPNRDPAAGLLALGALWSAVVHSGLLVPPARAGRATLAVGGLALVLALAAGLGFRGTPYFTLFGLFAFQLMSCYPVLKLLRAHRRSGSGAQLAWATALAVEFLALGAAGLARGGLVPELQAPLWAGLGLLAVSGYRLAQEGYLLEQGWQGLARRLDERERQLLAARTLLLESEAQVRLQDSLAGAGLLAAGAAHEFRGVLALIQAAAEHGLDRKETGAVEHALRLILEHVRQGRLASDDLLGRAAARKPGGGERLELPDDIAGLLRMARAACRREGIRLCFSQRPSVTVLAVRGELEQILLGLLRNAAESVRRHRRPGEGFIRIGFLPAEGPGGLAAVEVQDNGPGVDLRLGAQIFEPSVSSTGSTGLGLFIARRLAESAGGGLEYVPSTPGEGGCFRLLLPTAG
jgi:two-component system sensor histidine kinase HydH